MLSTRELQKTLPAKAPNTGRHRAVASGEFKIPVYALVTLQTNLEHLVKDVNHAETSTRSACNPPHADFTGKSLRDIYDYHLQLRDQDHTIYPLYFVVADQVDYNTNGVLVVFLDADTPGEDDDYNHVGVGRTGIDMVDAWASNIDVGNMSWMDLKESEAADWRGDDPCEGIDVSGQPRVSEIQGTNGKEASKYGWYSTFGAGTGKILEMLEPDFLKMPPEEARCRMLANVANMCDHWAGIRELHPESCQDNPQVHRTSVLVANKAEADEEDGMSVLRFTWDGEVDGLTTDQLRDIKPEMTVLRNLRASNALLELDKILMG